MSFFGPRGGKIAAEVVPVMTMPVQEVNDTKQEPATVYDTSVVSRDTIVTGNITSNSDVTVLGQVKGDIEAKGHVYVCGVVEGQISCDSVAMSACSVEGNIIAQTGVIQDAESTLVGDIQAQNLTAAGKIVGNAAVENCVSLKSSAVIIGDLSLRDFVVEQGAVVRGTITTNRPDVG